MMDLNPSSLIPFFTTLSLSYLFILLIFIFHFLSNSHPHSKTPCSQSYPIVGNLPGFLRNRHRFHDWITEMLSQTPSSTLRLRSILKLSHGIGTANPAYLEHFLHQNFPNYINELLGDGIFNIDGHPWTLQRKIASHEFNTRSLKHFISFTVNSEISNSLIPYLSSNEDKVIDLQDVSQRFRSDNICHVAFGVNPTCLTSYNMYQNSPSSNFVKAFNVAVEILLMIMIAPEQRTGTTSSRKKMI